MSACYLNKKVLVDNRKKEGKQLPCQRVPQLWQGHQNWTRKPLGRNAKLGTGFCPNPHTLLHSHFLNMHRRVECVCHPLWNTACIICYNKTSYFYLKLFKMLTFIHFFNVDHLKQKQNCRIKYAPSKENKIQNKWRLASTGSDKRSRVSALRNVVFFLHFQTNHWPEKQFRWIAVHAK